MIVIEQPLCTNSADDYVVLSDEALSLRGYEAYRCTDYHLGLLENLRSIIHENCFFQSVCVMKILITLSHRKI